MLQVRLVVKEAWRRCNAPAAPAFLPCIVLSSSFSRQGLCELSTRSSTLVPVLAGASEADDKDKDRLQTLLDMTDKKRLGSSDGQSGSNIESSLCQQLSTVFSSPEQLRSMFSTRSLRVDAADGRPPDNAFGTAPACMHADTSCSCMAEGASCTR